MSKLSAFDKHLRSSFRLDSSLRGKLRDLKYGINERLWALNSDYPLLGEPPESALLREISRNSTEAPVDGQDPHILFFSIRSWKLHRVLEVLLARRLIDSGAKVEAVVCEGLPRCDMYPLERQSFSQSLCANCLRNTRQTIHFGGAPITLMNAFLQPGEAEEIGAIVDNYTGDYQSFVFDGLTVGELVRPSVLRTLRAGSVENDPEGPRIYKDYLLSGALVARMARRMLESINPDIIVLLNGFFFAERIVAALAKEIGTIRMVRHERGFFKNHVFFDHSQAAKIYRVDNAWPARSELPLNTMEEEQLEDLLAKWQLSKNSIVDYWPTVEDRESFIVKELGLDLNRPIITAFTNILWDTAVYDSEIGFESMVEWLAVTIDWVADSEVLQLVIRIHPAEVRLSWWTTRERVLDRLRERYPELPENVVIVPAESEISSYALLDMSAAVCVYSSTIGLEASLKGLPVLVSGETHYRGKGFTVDVDTADQYVELLDIVDRGEQLASSNVALARRYAHLFFLQSMLPLDAITEAPDRSISFNFNSFDELKSDEFPTINHVCERILDGEPFSLP